LVGNQQDGGIGWRFFEFFEDRIGGIAVHFIGGIHDHDAAAPVGS